MNLSDTSAVYLAEFPDRLKIGRATYLRDRLRSHVAAGATWFAAWPVTWSNYWALAAEDEALAIAEQRGTRLRRGRHLLEEFTGLSRADGLDIMRQAVTRTEGGPAHEIIVNLDDLAPRVRAAA